MQSKPMHNKIAIVTGCAGGTGRVISTQLAKAGATIIIFERNVEKGNKAVEEIIASGGKAEFYRSDLTRCDKIEKSMRQVLAKYPGVDILVNSAGIPGFMGPLVEPLTQELEEILKLNLIGIFHLSKLALPKMIENKYGRIINISSAAPIVQRQHPTADNIGKVAVSTLTRSLSKEVASFGITVNAIAPGMVMPERVDHSPAPRTAGKPGISPEEMIQKFMESADIHRLSGGGSVAEMVMFLVSQASQGITGEIFDVAGGFWESHAEQCMIENDNKKAYGIHGRARELFCNFFRIFREFRLNWV